MVLANPNHVSYPFSIPAVPCARIQPVLTGAGADCLYWCRWGSVCTDADCLYWLVLVQTAWTGRCRLPVLTGADWPVLTGTGADCLYWCKWGSFKIQARSIFCTYTLRSVHVTFLWCAVLRCNARCAFLQYNSLTGHLLMCNDLALHATLFLKCSSAVQCAMHSSAIQSTHGTYAHVQWPCLACNIFLMCSSAVQCAMRSSAIQSTHWTFAPVQWPCLAHYIFIDAQFCNTIHWLDIRSRAMTLPCYWTWAMKSYARQIYY